MTKNCHSHKNSILIASLLMLAVSFAAFNIGTSLWINDLTVDVTPQRKYTLSEETLNWLQENTNKKYIKLYTSKNLEDYSPLLEQHIRHVNRLLSQYQKHSRYLLAVEYINIQPFSVAEKEAEKQGIRALETDNGNQRFYAGLVLGDDSGNSYTIPYLEPQRQHYLEHDITRILSLLKNKNKKQIAVMSPTLPLIQKKETFSHSHDWDFIRQLRHDYKVDFWYSDAVEIPLSYDVVILVNPQNMSTTNKYAMDQYLLYGGNIIIITDPLMEAQLSINNISQTRLTNLADFFASKGIKYNDATIIGDATIGADVNNTTTNEKVSYYPLWMNIQPPYINPQSALMKDLNNLMVKSSGSFAISDISDKKITTLYTTSENAGEIDNQTAPFISPTEIKDYLEGQKQRYRLALLVEGRFSSLFNTHPLENSEYLYKLRPFIAVSINPGRLALIGDSDMFANHNWNAAYNLAPQSIYDFIPYNNNMDFLERLVDEMSGSKLLSPAPKHLSKDAEPLNTIIHKIIWNKYKQKYDAEQLTLQQQKNELQTIKNELQRIVISPSLSISQRMTFLSQNITDTQNKLDKLNYKIETKKSLLKKYVIILNTIVFPLISLIILWGIITFFRHNKKQKAKEYTHD